MNFDMHTHLIPPEFIEAIAKPGSRWQAKLEKQGDERWLVHVQGYRYPLCAGFYDTAARLADMAKTRTDRAAVSLSPTLFYYWAEPRLALDMARMANDCLHALAQERPDKFTGIGTLPMQDLDLAGKELHRCAEQLGFRAIQIGSNVEGAQFDDPRFLPFFKQCESLDLLVIFHPYYVGAKQMFTRYYLTNLYGNPLDTAMVAASLIFGGVLDQCPNLKVCFVHGGGFFPYQIGRLKHGYEVRDEPKVNRARSPEKYLHQMYFDSVLFLDKQLRFLVEWAGADHVMLGSDYPFDMGDAAPADFVSSAGLTAAQTTAVLSDTARKLFDA